MQEHYPAIVLAVEGMANETNCDSQGHTFVDWTKMTPDGRPRSFRRREINDELIEQARQAGNSAAAVKVPSAAAAAGQRLQHQHPQAALEAAKQRLYDARTLLRQGWFWTPPPPPVYPMLNETSPLFIRKFPVSTVRTATQVFAPYLADGGF